MLYGVLSSLKNQHEGKIKSIAQANGTYSIASVRVKQVVIQ